MKELLGDFWSEVLSGVSNQILKLQNEIGVPSLRLPDALDATEFVGRHVVDSEVVPKFCNGKYDAFCYAAEGSNTRKFWMVPADFKFPKVDRLGAWNFWLLGMPDHLEKNDSGDMVIHAICPFRFFMLKISHFV